MLRALFVVVSVLILQSCADPPSGAQLTYDSFVDEAYKHAGQNAVDCGAGDKFDDTVISCVQNSFNNGVPAVGIFWVAKTSVIALSVRDSMNTSEYVYLAAAPGRGGEGSRKVKTIRFFCIDPEVIPDADSVHSVFDCKERIQEN